MIKALLFDLDGTLINTNKLIIKAYKYAFKKHLNMEVPESEIVKTFGGSLIQAMKAYSEEKTQMLCDTYRNYVEEFHDKYAESFDGVKQAIEELKNKGFKIAVVTAQRRNLAVRGLKLFGLYDYMDEVITPELTQKHKPDAEPALRACSLLDVTPDETIMTGDSHNDILCGKSAGCRTCVVKYTTLNLKNLYKLKPDYSVDNIKELINIVDSINQNSEKVG